MAGRACRTTQLGPRVGEGCAAGNLPTPVAAVVSMRGPRRVADRQRGGKAFVRAYCVNDLATHHGQDSFNVGNLVFRHGEVITVEDRKVGILTRRQLFL